MTSEQGKTEVQCYWYCRHWDIAQTGYAESTSFGATNSPTRFYLRLDNRANLTLHLATCSQKKLHIDKFEVWATSSSNSSKHTVNGDVFLGGYTQVADQICCPLGEVNINWNIDCTITYSEPLVKTDHKQPLSEHLAALRLDSDSCDVTLVTVADGKEHSAHKLILSMRSPVFAAMFKHEGLLENVLNRVEIEEVTGEVMEAFLDYVYSGNVRKVDQFAVQLFELANKYDIQPLAKACIEAISVDNAAQLYYLADLQQEENFKKLVLRFISANKEAVKKTNGWNVFVEPHAKLLSQLIDYL